MLNCFCGEGVLINDPVKVDSKQDDRFFAVFSMFISREPYTQGWMIQQIKEHRKTGMIFIGAITQAGKTSERALKTLRRGDMISFYGPLTRVKNGEDLLGVRIERFEKIASNCIKNDYRNIQKTQTMMRSPQQSQDRPQYTEQKTESRYNGYQRKPDKEILDDTEFNFEQADES